MKPVLISSYGKTVNAQPPINDHLAATIRAIARATKRALQRLRSSINRFFAYLKEKDRESAEIYLRAQERLEDRYTQNWHSTRRDRW